jgi:hypothetical protein
MPKKKTKKPHGNSIKKVKEPLTESQKAYDKKCKDYQQERSRMRREAIYGK